MEKLIIKQIEEDIKLYKKTDQDILRLDLLNLIIGHIEELKKKYYYLK